MSCENDELVRKLLECQEESKEYKADLDKWIDSIEELSEIEKAFTFDKRKGLGKTILDVGTDCVKPFYIALRFKAKKIIGINECLSSYSFASDLEKNSKLFTNTEIRFENCSLFDEVTLDKILKEEGMNKGKKFDFVLVSKTLHHLRNGKCVAKKRDKKHEHEKDETEKCCIYQFDEKEIFKRLLDLGKRVIVYEWFDPNEEDEDKVRGRGGYFTSQELEKIITHLSETYKIRFIKPRQFSLNKETPVGIDLMLREVDCICFYVENGN
jgi:hypothetical protein